MKSKISKAQKEVWLWKEKASKELLSIPEDQWFDFIRASTQQTIANLKKKKSKAV